MMTESVCDIIERAKSWPEPWQSWAGGLGLAVTLKHEYGLQSAEQMREAVRAVLMDLESRMEAGQEAEVRQEIEKQSVEYRLSAIESSAYRAWERDLERRR